jgi:hypothetical protein
MLQHVLLLFLSTYVIIIISVVRTAGTHPDWLLLYNNIIYIICLYAFFPDWSSCQLLRVLHFLGLIPRYIFDVWARNSLKWIGENLWGRPPFRPWTMRFWNTDRKMRPYKLDMLSLPGIKSNTTCLINVSQEMSHGRAVPTTPAQL